MGSPRTQARKDAFKMPLLRHCHYCAVALQGDTITMDHVVPRWVSKTNVRRNFVPCCGACNNKKGNRRSRCVCAYCLAAWEEFGHGEDREVELRMPVRTVSADEVVQLRHWSSVSETKKFRKLKGALVMVERTEMALGVVTARRTDAGIEMEHEGRTWLWPGEEKDPEALREEADAAREVEYAVALLLEEEAARRQVLQATVRAVMLEVGITGVEYEAGRERGFMHDHDVDVMSDAVVDAVMSKVASW